MKSNINTNNLLSTLWIFLTLNYIFCDVFTLMYGPELQQLLNGTIGGIEITQEFLLSFALILELPMLMIIISKFVKYRINRILNIIIAVLMFVVQSASLFAGDNTLHYIFFSAVEILTTVIIFIIAIKWRNDLTTN
jgi:hypothetical protein